MLPNIADVGRASDWKGVVLRQSKMHSMTYAFSLLLFLQSYQITVGQDPLFSINYFNFSSNTLGVPASLVCDASNVINAPIMYSILKDGDALDFSGERISGSSVGTRFVVSFKYLLAVDIGTYTCIAEVDSSTISDFPRRTKEVALTVDISTLHFVNENQSTYFVEPNKTTDIDACATNQELYGDGSVSVTWSFNDQSITLGNDYTYTEGKLTISNFNINRHVGTYRCIVQVLEVAGKRQASMISRSFVVTIDGGPKVIGLPGFVHFFNATVDGRTVYRVNCSMYLRYPGVPTTYDWQRKPYPSNVRRTFSDSEPYVDSQNSLILTYAHPEHSNQYRCFANNMFGSNYTYFNVTIAYPAPIIWVQFWMIIIYVVVVLALLILCCALIIRFCCCGFCYIKDKKVIVDSTFYTTSKFEEQPEKIPLHDKTEFQEVEVEMQLADVGDSDDEGNLEIPPEVDLKPKKPFTEYQEVEIEPDYPWDDEKEADKLYGLDLVEEKSAMVRSVTRKERERRRQEERRAVVELHRPPSQQLPEPEPVPDTPESQKKLSPVPSGDEEETPYEKPPQKLILPPPPSRETTEVFKVIREEKKLITTTVEEEEDDDDVRSAESQVIERTFGYSDIDSEEPPDSDYNP